jgi:hypothetical protein
MTIASPNRWSCLVGVVVLCLACGSAAGQGTDEPLLPRLADLGRWATDTDNDRPCVLRNRCIRLFRMPTGFASDPVGADLDADQVPADAGTPAATDDPDLPVQAALYSDNPYFDFRRPGDVGGPGFYRIYTQVQLFETDSTGCTLGLQAVTPAGLENDGLADGPTAFYPNLALVHEPFDGVAVAGFVGKSLRARPGWEDHMGHSLHYGVAVAQALPCLDTLALPRVHLFLEALGRYRVDGEASAGGQPVWELLPGLHWQMRENWWLTGGVLMPLNAPLRDLNVWQVTCSWQF